MASYSQHHVVMKLLIWLHRCALACSAVTVFTGELASQLRPTRMDHLAAAQSSERRITDPKAFAIEAFSGSLGSLFGIGVVGLVSDCGVEDLGCLILSVGAGGVMGAVGATIGTSLAARATNSPRSITGAALGAVVGTGVGLGVHYLLNRMSDRNFDDAAAVVPIFVLSQGIVSALGSRLLGSN
jgi:hypothetical protein